MRIGDKVKVNETGQVGEIISIVDGRVTHIKDEDTGKVIEVVDKAITVLTIFKSFWGLIKGIFGK